MSNEEAHAAVVCAIDSGYRLIDTASSYRNEAGVGQGVKASGIARDEIFVTTKLRRDGHGYEAAQRAFDDSARLLGLDYIDLFLIHWPNPQQDRYVEAWQGLIKLLADGKVRAIGVSNFREAHLRRLIDETATAPDVNQIQVNPIVGHSELRQFNAEHGIVTESWGPLGTDGSQLENADIQRIARAHGRTAAQIILRWHHQLGLVPIPKSSQPDRIRSNVQILDFTLSAEEVESISALDQGDVHAVDSDTFGL